jgi:hypothetical protein
MGDTLVVRSILIRNISRVDYKYALTIKAVKQKNKKLRKISIFEIAPKEQTYHDSRL